MRLSLVRIVIVDKGFFIALGNKKYDFYERAKQQLQRLREPLITTYPVIVETSYLLFKRCGNEKQFIFLVSLFKEIFKFFN